ncbi:hypothetical protein CERSUDRAFT_26726, partial [Gelatoporia subvermispora B]
HTFPDLPYVYDALEPFILCQVIEFHRKKHYQTCVNALNAAVQRERIALQQEAGDLPCAGRINYSPLWKHLAPAQSEGKGAGSALAAGLRKDAFDMTSGSAYAFTLKELNTATAGTQRSSWGWL